MSPDLNTWFVVSGALGLSLVGLFSSPAVLKAFRPKPVQPIRLDDEVPGKKWYQDEDGEAAEESQESYSNMGQRIAITLFSATGLASALALLVVSTRSRHSPLLLPSWLQSGIWILLSIESVTLFVPASPVECYRLGLHVLASSIVAIAVPGIQMGLLRASSYSTAIDLLPARLLVLIAASAFARGLSAIHIPRRPNVYHEALVVDRERTVSLRNRISFSWATPVLHYVGKNRGLDIDALPKQPYFARAEPLHKRLQTMMTSVSQPLWVILIWFKIRPLVLQLLLSILMSLLELSRQMAMYGMLKSMEDPSYRSGTRAWLCVTALGLVSPILLGLNSWISWTMYSRLWIPTYAGLSALVFAKSMRCKTVSHPGESKTQDAQLGESDEEKQSQQSVFNMAAVDIKRISDFATVINLLPSSLMRLLIASALLFRLVGWQSMMASVLVALVFVPASWYATKCYAASQEEYMEASDKHITIVTEMVRGIRQVKFDALELLWQNRVAERRDAQLRSLWNALVHITIMESVWIFGPILVSATCLTVYALENGELPASVAFTVLSVFESLQAALSGLPDMLSRGMDARVSANRVEKYLVTADKAVHTSSQTDKITFEDATIAWTAEPNSVNEDRFKLGPLNLQFPRGGLSVITGKSGSGKSLLLASILGECDILRGTLAVPTPPSMEAQLDDRATPGTWVMDSLIAYVGQSPWIENGSIKENIVFDLPYQHHRYHQVLFVTGLEKDLETMPDGDKTDVGRNGVNLSGGQRWRISFARALYSRAGILVMDDIFSALDPKTGRHIYTHALTGELGQGRTRILVTHHLGLCLPQADYCVLLEDGGMVYAETTKHLERKRPFTGGLQEAADLPDPVTPPSRSVPNKFAQEENRQTGSVSWAVYKAYLVKGGGLPRWALTFLAYATFMTLLLGRSWWLKLWTGSSDSSKAAEPSSRWLQTIMRVGNSSIGNDTIFFLGIYVAISVTACVVGVFKYLVLSYSSLHTSRHMFQDLLTSILTAPMRWLDTVPIGALLNRFTSDIQLLDWRLGYDLGNVMYKNMELVGIIVAGGLVSPILLAFAAALFLVCLHIARIYITGARELKRLESVAKSPVLEHFSSSLMGLSTIRAFGREELYLQRMYSKIDRHAQAAWHLWLFNNWLGFRVSMVGAFFTTATAALVVHHSTNISAALAGFAVSFALQYNSAVSMCLRSSANLEMDMNAAERVLEYTANGTEDQGGEDPPAAWPASGHIEVANLSVSYAPTLPPVLNSVSFSVRPGERVGIVGRTGAGKSSLAMALFRFLETPRGSVFIDGIDISTIKLCVLRRRIAMIPQDPVFFSGTVRSNLDPRGECSDLELYRALECVHLNPTGDRTSPSRDGDLCFSSLSFPIVEGGSNLSQGQRQLLCLARAIASRPKVLILDEATSAVDMQTDALLQRSIREEFCNHGSSLLVIAHRLSTVADFDKILVFDAGRAVEFGTPQELLHLRDGVFCNLVSNSGERSLVKKIILGERRRE